jgi:chromate reductase
VVIFSLSGSLREQSSNTALLKTMKNLGPAGVEFIMYKSLGELPHYNADLDTAKVPDAVRELRGAVNRSQGIMITTPEYAHGIPGALKNALDWLVNTTALEGKPVAVVMGQTDEGTFARDALVEVLKTMKAKIVPELVKTISGAHDKANSPQTWHELQSVVENLILISRAKS